MGGRRRREAEGAHRIKADEGVGIQLSCDRDDELRGQRKGCHFLQDRYVWKGRGRFIGQVGGERFCNCGTRGAHFVGGTQ